MDPTDEQQDAIDLFTAGLGLAIEAGAGTGKTSTLKMIGLSTPRAGQYVAFNRAIVDEARQKMPRNVTASTAHSLAFRSVGRRYAHRLNSGRQRGDQIARELGIDPLPIRYGDTAKMLQPGFLAGHVMRAITRFCQSDEDGPGRHHVAYIDGIDPIEDGRRTFANNDLVRDHIGPALGLAWRDVCNPDGRLKFSHDNYLKIWQLGEPHIAADFILFDEAQDAAPVILAAIEAQRHAQLVFVGDSCQPAGTLVDVVTDANPTHPRVEQRPIEAIREGDRVVSYDVAGAHLHRTGRGVAGVAVRPFYGELITAKVGAERSRYTPDHHCVARIGDAFDGRHVVYLMRRGTSYRVGRASGTYASQYRAFGPALRAATERADALWLLSVHETSEEAAVAEALASYRFGVPMMLFQAAQSRLVSQRAVDDFWLAMGDLTENAAALLTAHGRDVRFPLWTAGERRLLVRRAATIRACNLMNGMQLLGSNGWLPASVTREPYAGPVYSLTVDDLHTYIADGVVTHNCQQIYEWRGAVNALQQVPAEARALLTQSFRFGPAIADVANRILGRLDAELRLRGLDSIDSHVETTRTLPLPDCVLTRTNATAMSTVLDYQRQGRAVHLVGGGGEVAAFARAAGELMESGSTWYPDLACFSSWNEVVEYVALDPQGDELALLVKLVDEYGVDVILAALDNMPAEDHAEVVVSTAHKAKGREWATVQLAGDFTNPAETDSAAGEWRLLYVAATRARLVLDVSLCQVLAEMCGRRPQRPMIALPASLA